MTDEIFGLMECFLGSYINRFGEIILSEKGNVYFTAKNCTDKEDIICKLLEWCSRPMAKGEPYSSHKRNNEWREQLISSLNRYLGTNFDQEDMYWIYDQLGNAVNHKLTLRFIRSDFNMAIIYQEAKGGRMMEKITLDDMIKALKCVASQDVEGDCYADHENFMHMDDDEHKRIVCGTGENLKDYISGKEAVACPYNQNEYGCCFEDGELFWLKDIAELLEELKELRAYKEKMEMQYLDDIENPLEPLKISAALESEIFKYNYRKENKPEEINILDYTVMHALKHCLEEKTKEVK